MKKIYFLLIALYFFSTANAQIVNIPDANFKAKLLAATSDPSSNGYYVAKDISGFYIKIDSNNDGEIQESEALMVYSLNVQASSIIDLTGIEVFTNLHTLDCSRNQLTSLNVSGLSELVNLICNDNKLISLDVSG